MNLKLSLQHSFIIKGVAIVLLMIHHYSGMGYAASQLEIFQGLGPVICGAFFFCSGYGLAVSGNGHDWRYWCIRFSKILIPFMLANALYIAYWYFFRRYNLSFSHVLGDLTGITLVNGHCWFLQVLILLYISYAMTVRRSCKLLILSAVLFGFAYTFLTKNYASLSWIGFPIGIICARHELHFPRLILWILLLLSATTFYIHQYCFGRHIVSISSILNLIAMVATSIPLWIAFVRIHEQFIFRILSPSSKIIPYFTAFLKFMGKRSMDFYMMHGMSLLILSKMKTHDQLKLIPVYIISIILLSFVFHYLSKTLLRYPVNWLQNTAPSAATV